LEIEIEAKIQESKTVSLEDLDKQLKLMNKVKEVKNIYSFWLFLENYLKDWGLKNCRGNQERF